MSRSQGSSTAHRSGSERSGISRARKGSVELSLSMEHPWLTMRYLASRSYTGVVTFASGALRFLTKHAKPPDRRFKHSLLAASPVVTLLIPADDVDERARSRPLAAIAPVPFAVCRIVASAFHSGLLFIFALHGTNDCSHLLREAVGIGRFVGDYRTPVRFRRGAYHSTGGPSRRR